MGLGSARPPASSFLPFFPASAGSEGQKPAAIVALASVSPPAASLRRREALAAAVPGARGGAAAMLPRGGQCRRGGVGLGPGGLLGEGALPANSRRSWAAGSPGLGLGAVSREVSPPPSSSRLVFVPAPGLWCRDQGPRTWFRPRSCY